MRRTMIVLGLWLVACGGVEPRPVGPREEDTVQVQERRTFVLVHGSWHGAWAWYRLVPELERAGHRVVAIDLPGHGRSWRPPRDVTLADYVDTVVTAIDREEGPVVLVGHSRGGIVISQAAEERPDRIAGLVYLCAFLIPNGEPMLPTALGDEGSWIGPNLVLDEAEGFHMLRREAFRDALYGDCAEQDVVLASSLLTPEPNAPVATPLHLTEERWGRIPRAYVLCSQDRGISVATQRAMIARVGVDEVVTMETSHSPFFSAPTELARTLGALALRRNR